MIFGAKHHLLTMQVAEQKERGAATTWMERFVHWFTRERNTGRWPYEIKTERQLIDTIHGRWYDYRQEYGDGGVSANEQDAREQIARELMDCVWNNRVVPELVVPTLEECTKLLDYTTDYFGIDGERTK